MARKSLTVEEYQRLGSKILLLLLVAQDVSNDIPLKSIYDKDFKLVKKKLESLRWDMEDKMFKDYPDLSDDYLKAFSGSFYRGKDTDVDKEKVMYAIEYLEELKHKVRDLSRHE